MAYNKVVIDVEARFQDSVSGKVSKLDHELDNIEKKRKVTVEADTGNADAKIDKVDHKLDNLGKKKPMPTIDAKDEASSKIEKILAKAKRLSDKVYTAALKLKDHEALSTLTKLDHKLSQITKTAWTATLKVRDFALAPLNRLKKSLFSIKGLIAGIVTGVAFKKFVMEPTKMYANYKDLVTQFKVLLGSKDKAANRIQELTDFAGETPFTRDEIYQASRVLQTYTQGALATPDAPGGLRMIGDIAAATGQEYTQVATYMGRLYNEVKRGGESMGEPLAYLREMGALSAEQEENIKKIATGSGSIEQKWQKIAGQFSSVDGMMKEMSNETNNLLLGVKSFFKNNVLMKIGKGVDDVLNPFLQDFRTWRSENKDFINQMGSAIENFARTGAEKVLGMARKTAGRISRIINSQEFKNADMFGKVDMIWKGAFKNPFEDWWNKTVKPWWDTKAMPWLSEKAQGVGEIIGKGLSEGLLTLLGVDVAGAAEDGISIGASFVKGFMKGFDAGAITKAIVKAIGDVWGALPWWAKIMVGGRAAAGAANMLTGGLSGIMKVAGGIKGGIGAMQAGTGAAGNLALMTMQSYENAGMYSAIPGVAGSAMLGAGAVAGGVVGGATVASGIYDMAKAGGDQNLNAGEGTMARATFEGGASKLAGVGMGALIGTAIMPGIGTAIGAGVGGVAGILGSKLIKKNAAESIRTMKELEEAAKSSAEADEVLQERRNKIYEATQKEFGKLAMSADEVNKVVDNMFKKSVTGISAFNKATADANNAFTTMESTATELDKIHWKIGVGYKMNKEESKDYKKVINDYIDQTNQYLENSHYEINAAVDVLFGPDKKKKGKTVVDKGKKDFLDSIDDAYTKIQEQLDGNEKEIDLQIEAAMKNGKIDADEDKIIQELLEKRQRILDKLNRAQQQADQETLEARWSNGRLNSDTFGAFMESINAHAEEQKNAAYDAYNTAMMNANLVGGEKGEALKAQAKSQLEEALSGIDVDIADMSLKLLGDEFTPQLGSDADEKLATAIQTALATGTSPIDWSTEDMANILGVENLSDSAATAIGNQLSELMSNQSIVDAMMPDADTSAKISEALKQSYQEGVDSAFSEVDFSPSLQVAMNRAGVVMPPLDLSGMETTGTETVTSTVQSDVDASVKAAVADTFNATAKISITPKITNPGAVHTAIQSAINSGSGGSGGGSKNQNDGNGFRGGIIYPFGKGIPGYSDGGQVRGGAQLIKVAEEGDPEMIIPLGSQRRKRGLDLWAKAGQMMGVPGFANGGIVGNADEGIRHHDTGGGASSGSGSVQVNVGGVTVEVNVQGGADADVAQAIAEQSGEIAEQVAGILADAFSSQFQNTPAKGVA